MFKQCTELLWPHIWKSFQIFIKLIKSCSTKYPAEYNKDKCRTLSTLIPEIGLLVATTLLQVYLLKCILIFQTTVSFEVRYFSPDGKVGAWNQEEMDYPLMESWVPPGMQGT